MLSKACVVGSYQRKLEELASFPDVELKVAVPPFWMDGRRKLPLQRAYTQGYTLEILPVVLNGHFHLYFYRGLSDLVRRFRPDIMHIDEEPYNLSTWQAMRVARRAQARPLFFTWQNILRQYPFPFSWWERYNLDHALHAIAGSLEAKEVLLHKGYHGPVEIIPQFGVDPELFHPSTKSSSGDSFVIGYAGRIVEEKGVRFLVQALAEWDDNWHLKMVGEGPLRPVLTGLNRELDVWDRIDLLDPMASTEMPAFYSGLDVLVLPSLTRPNWKEQFGRVLVEAMACEVPVVGSDSGEISNVIGKAGMVFPEADGQALRDRLQELRSDPSLRKELGRLGRERVLNCFTQARIAAATREVYLKMMQASEEGD
jgi:glycosyltransferase involved in cell wall biosynthesis